MAIAYNAIAALRSGCILKPNASLNKKIDMETKLDNTTNPQHDAKLPVSGWRMFTVKLTLNNGLKTKYISSMEGIDEVKAKEIAIKQDWISDVKSVDSVSFDA